MGCGKRKGLDFSRMNHKPSGSGIAKTKGSTREHSQKFEPGVRQSVSSILDTHSDIVNNYFDRDWIFPSLPKAK